MGTCWTHTVSQRNCYQTMWLDKHQPFFHISLMFYPKNLQILELIVTLETQIRDVLWVCGRSHSLHLNGTGFNPWHLQIGQRKILVWYSRSGADKLHPIVCHWVALPFHNEAIIYYAWSLQSLTLGSLFLCMSPQKVLYPKITGEAAPQYEALQSSVILNGGCGTEK